MIFRTSKGRSRSFCTAALAVSFCLLLASCGGGSDGEDQPETTTTTSETTTSSATSEAPPTTVGEVPEVSAPAVSDETTRLTGVEVTGEDGAGRIAFTFSGAVPGYTIGYTTLPPRQDGSGNAVSLQGQAGIALRFNPSSTVDLTGGYNKTYNGPDRVAGASDSNIAEVVQVSDYERSLVWAVGVRNKARFDVTTASNPSRVIVQLQR